MDSSRNFRIKTYSLLAVTVVLNSLGNVLLSKGMKDTGAVDLRISAVLPFFLKALASSTIWLAIGILLLFFVGYLLVLSRADYSYVSPASAAGYGLVALLGSAVLGEQVTIVRWIGIALICGGVTLVGRTPPRTLERQQ